MIGGISVWQLLIILAIIILIFGTKKLRNIGGDLGGAIKSFKKAVNEEDSNAAAAEKKQDEPTRSLPNADDKAQQKDADFDTSANTSANVNKDKSPGA